jgi:hypothetical protein
VSHFLQSPVLFAEQKAKPVPLGWLLKTIGE